MAEKNNAKCSICGRDYYMCLSCKDTMSIHPWKAFCDTAEHYKVFQVVKGYSTKVYTKDEARTKLKNINLEDLESYRPHIKKIIKDILREEKPVVKTVEVETEIATEEKTVIEKPIISRKKNFKVEVE